MVDLKALHEMAPAHFPNLAKSLIEGKRMTKKSARVAQHKYSHISFLYLNLGLILIGLEQRAARMSHIMCKSYTSRLKWKAEGMDMQQQITKILVD